MDAVECRSADPHTLLSSLREDRVTIRLAGDSVTFVSRRGVLSPEVREALNGRKHELSRWIKEHELHIPPKYHSASLSDFGESKETVFRQFCADPAKQLLLTGECGTGKTRALYAILIHSHENGTPCELHVVPDLVKHLQVACSVDTQAEHKEIKRLAGYRGILFLDDLGAEKVTQFVLQDLYLIISEREKWDRPTVVTSNLSLQEIAEKMDDRIASRLAGGAVLQLGGEDYRLPPHRKSRRNGIPGKASAP